MGDRLCVDCLCLYESLKGFSLLLLPLSLWARDLAKAAAKFCPPKAALQQLLDAALPQ